MRPSFGRLVRCWTNDVIFDVVNLPRGVANDVDQHVGLIAQQMGQQLRG